MPLRVGIVGARRRRQGIGQYVAGHLTALGAEVVAIVGTRPDTLRQAQRQLQKEFSLETVGYLELEEMLACESLDAVAICSPYRFHREHLARSLAAGVHVLCEKPLLFDARVDSADAARQLVNGFAAAGKALMVNEQWPYTLPAFEELHPDSGLHQSAPRTLSMLLSPDTAGAEMIPNALPHVLSLLFALAPGGGETKSIEVVRIEGEQGFATAADVFFSYRRQSGQTDVTVMLRQSNRQPRPAGYEINGRAVQRKIEMPGYRMFLQAAPAIAPASSFATNYHLYPAKSVYDGAAAVAVANEVAPCRVALEDPLRLLLAEFLNRCNTATVVTDFNRDRSLLERLAILQRIHTEAQKKL